MTHAEDTTGLEFGSLLSGGLRLARQRWGTLFILIVALDWGPRFGLFLSGTHYYATGSHNAGAFAGYALQYVLLIFCSYLMQTSAAASALGATGARVSATRATLHVLRRLPALAPWWLLISAPGAVTLWLRWSAPTPDAYWALYVWRLTGDTVFDIAVSSAVGLFWLVVLTEDLGGRSALSRSLSLMSGRRRIVFAVVFAGDAVGLLINLATPYLTDTAVNLGLGRNGEVLATYFMAFVWEAVAALMNLTLLQLYRELVRAHDGVAPGELTHIFA